MEEGSLAYCPWCSQDTPYCGIKYPKRKPIFKCRICKRNWAVINENGSITTKRINLEGKVV